VARPPKTPRRRVLFIGEGATLAHAARPLALAAALPKDRYEVVLALPERYRAWVPAHVAWRPLKTQDPALFVHRLTEARPLFSTRTLRDYFAWDMKLIEEVRPDAIVGDLRLSLAASAREAKTPYLAVSNAYWSDQRPLRIERPALTALRWMPPPMAELAFRVLQPGAVKGHVKPLARLLASRGLDIPLDVRRIVTEADVTLWADIPALFPEVAETARARFVGPLSWEPPMPPPPWWDTVPADRPIAYLTLGGSGPAKLLAPLAGWLVEAGYTVLAATAGQGALETDGERLFVADYLPGAAAAARAALVVCNGGAPTATQALVAGRPVLGVCANVDHFLNMRAVQAAGAGLVLRAERLGRRRFQAALARLRAPVFARAAEALQADARGLDPAATLDRAIQDLLAVRP